MENQELHLKQLNPTKDERYGNVTMFMNPSNQALYTRKEKIFETEYVITNYFFLVI